MSIGPEAFGEDYLYFYETMLGAERSDLEAELVGRLLGVQPGTSVLDLACGHGRIGNRLAERGAEVTGYDADRYFLERARSDARARGVEATYLEGDMRALPWEARFDAALLWFTAFGYFDEEGNRAVLREVRRALRPGGRFVLEMIHLPWLLLHQQRQLFVRRGVDVMLDENTWHPASSEMETRRTVVRDGAVRQVGYTIRMFMPAELRDWLEEAGFEGVELLGRERLPVSSEDRRLVALARTRRT